MFRNLISLLLAAGLLTPASVAAQTVKIGLINSYTGFVAQPGDEAQKGIDLYVKEHEKDLPPGVKIELLRRDDTSNPDVGKRLAQELITRDRVQLLTGIILSPVAAAIAPLTAEAKVPFLISGAGAGAAITRISPYIVRITFTLWQQALSDRQMGFRAGLEDRLYRGQRLYSGARFRGSIHQGVHRCRRQDRRQRSVSAEQSRLLAVRSAHQGRQARGRLHLRAGRHAGDRDDEGDQAISACARLGSTSPRPRIWCPTRSCRIWATRPWG